MAVVVFGTTPGNWSDDTKWVGGSKPASGDTASFIATSGNCTLDAAQTIAAFDASLYAGVFTHNAFVLTVNGSATFHAIGLMTYTPLATSTLKMGATGTLTTGGNLMPLITHTSGTLTLGDNLSFMASKVITLTLSGTALALSSFTVSGQSAINRVLIRSSAVGTPKQITMGTGTFAYADFQDITFSKASDLDLSAITGNSGDCGGNTLTGGGTTLTLTGSVQQTFQGTASDSWSTNAWTTRVPLPQDDVVISSAFTPASRVVTSDMPRLGRNITFGCTGSPTFTNSIAQTIYGGIDLTGVGAFSGTNLLTLAGRSNYTLTTAGLSYQQSITIDAPGGSYDVLDAFSMGATRTFTLNRGGFTNTGGYNVTFGAVTNSSGFTRSMTLGTGHYYITSAATGVRWSTVTPALTFSGASSIIEFSTTAAVSRSFSGGGLTWGTLIYTVAGSTGELDITDGNSFAQINFSDATNARSLKFTAGTTTTIRNANGFNVVGTSGKKMTVTSITAATHTITSTQQQATDYITPTFSIVDASPKWYAGANSNDGGNTTNWLFTDAPPTVSLYLSLLGVG